MRAAAAPRRAPAVAPARALARRRCRARRVAALAVAAPEAFEVPVRLNTTPHSRSTRQLFYADVVASFAAAVADGVPRGRLWCEWTELNTETDVYVLRGRRAPRAVRRASPRPGRVRCRAAAQTLRRCG